MVFCPCYSARVSAEAKRVGLGIALENSLWLTRPLRARGQSRKAKLLPSRLEGQHNSVYSGASVDPDSEAACSLSGPRDHGLPTQPSQY